MRRAGTRNSTFDDDYEPVRPSMQAQMSSMTEGYPGTQGSMQKGAQYEEYDEESDGYEENQTHDHT